MLQELITVDAWLSHNPFGSVLIPKSSSLFSSSSTTSSSILEDPAVIVAPPSWDELSEHLTEIQQSSNEEGPVPLITLFRDTNGWCPFCERVWFALKIKNIPYQETLINLYDKPKWFLDMVPTGLVPVVLIHTDTIEKQKEGQIDDDEAETKTKPRRTMVWESLDILKALDEHFPDTPKLIYEDDEEYMNGRKLVNELSNVGFQYVYNMRNETLTAEEKETQLVKFEEKLDELDEFIGSHTKSSFFLDEISGLDVEAVPTLERWRYQLPLTKNMDITDGRPNIKKWFAALDQYQPYVERVAGDEYSWTAVASTFLKLFGSNKDGLSQETKDTIAKVEKEADDLRSKFQLNPHDSDLFTKELLEDGGVEAAAKLIQNHDAIVKDCTNKGPKSQEDLGRAEDEKNADWVVRTVAAKLLGVTSTDSTESFDLDENDAAKAAKIISSRLCVPRDMGSPAAAVLRYELANLLSALE